MTAPDELTAGKLLQHLRAIPMTEWVWSDALMIFDVLERAALLADEGEWRIEGSIYEGMEACISDGKRTIAHVPKYKDALDLLSRLQGDAG